MARITVNNLLQNVALTVNQSSTGPSDGAADWLLWIAFLNRSQVEWAESNDWEQLKKYYYPAITSSVGASLVSIGLPLDFRKLSGPIVNYSSGVDGGESWPEILPEHKLQYSTSDKWFFVFGDPNNGYSLQWNPGTLASGSTIEISYYSMPTSLASGSQYPVAPDSEFLTQRTIAYVLEARSDPRYQDEERKARERLLTMIENANVAKYSSYVSPQRVQTNENIRGFRIGRS